MRLGLSLRPESLEFGLALGSEWLMDSLLLGRLKEDGLVFVGLWHSEGLDGLVPLIKSFHPMFITYSFKTLHYFSLGIGLHGSTVLRR